MPTGEDELRELINGLLEYLDAGERSIKTALEALEQHGAKATALTKLTSEADAAQESLARAAEAALTSYDTLGAKIAEAHEALAALRPQPSSKAPDDNLFETSRFLRHRRGGSSDACGGGGAVRLHSAATQGMDARRAPRPLHATRAWRYRNTGLGSNAAAFATETRWVAAVP